MSPRLHLHQYESGGGEGGRRASASRMHPSLCGTKAEMAGRRRTEPPQTMSQLPSFSLTHSLSLSVLFCPSVLYLPPSINPLSLSPSIYSVCLSVCLYLSSSINSVPHLLTVDQCMSTVICVRCFLQELSSHHSRVSRYVSQGLQKDVTISSLSFCGEGFRVPRKQQIQQQPPCF